MFVFNGCDLAQTFFLLFFPPPRAPSMLRDFCVCSGLAYAARYAIQGLRGDDVGIYPYLAGGIKRSPMHLLKAGIGSGFVRMSAIMSSVGMYDTVAFPKDISCRM